MVIAYDISNNKSRRQVHRILKAWRLDGQKSVVECYLTHWESQELLLQLSEYLNLDSDRLVVSRIDPQRKRESLGLGINNHPTLVHYG
jgi:CRISPR-associated protein Cas2